MKKTCLLFLSLFMVFLHLHAQSTAYAQNGVTVAGGGPFGDQPNQLRLPNASYVDAAGNVYVADGNNYRVQKWAPGASAGVTVAGGNGPGIAANQLSEPTDIFVDPAGNIYVADPYNHRVQKFAPGSLTGVTVAGGNGNGLQPNQLTFPNGIFVDAQGNIFIADGPGGRVKKWAPGASEGVTLISNLYGNNTSQDATDVVVDANGNLYVSESVMGTILKFAPGSTVGTVVAGGNGNGPAPNQLYAPKEFWVDAQQNIFVPDFFNDRIQKWVPGAVSGMTVAGGNGYGSAPNQLAHPTGIFMTGNGTLYITDQYNHRVQRFDVLGACPGDVAVTASSCSGTAQVSWTAPKESFPASFDIPSSLDPTQGSLVLMDTLNGHGYYKSTGLYHWPDARYISEYLGDTGTDGHLVTITSAAESNFLYYLTFGTKASYWIGLYSTGKPGSFRWVTDEALGFTRWEPGEPNNYQGTPSRVTEPYVNMYEAGSWNDQSSTNNRFITEFEKPLIRVRQISGPVNGSQQPVGTYMVAYEKFNSITGQKDTCSFRVTVSCPDAGVQNPPSAARLNPETSAEKGGTAGKLHAKIYPNPSTTQFTLNINSGAQGRVSMQIVDITGKIVEAKTGLAPGQVLRIGTNLKAGVYFVELRQGTEKTDMKMVKQGR